MPMIKTDPVYKICPTCGNSFAVCPPGKASRTYPSNKQVFCGNICSYKARYRHGRLCTQLTPFDAAYIAGFLDGEGSIILYRRRDKVAMRVTFANTNLSVLEWMAQVIACGSIVAKKGGKMHKPGYFLQINADAAASLLRQVRPYLHIKSEQADLAITFQERLQDPTLNSDRLWQYDYRANMQYMNQRGPRL